MNEFKKARMKLTFREEERPLLLDISSLLYDFELLHDFFSLLHMERHKEYRFGRYFWYRNGRPLEDEDRVRVVAIVKLSPLVVDVIAGAAALAALLVAIQATANWRLNSQKLKLEIERLQREANTNAYKEETARVELEKKIRERDAWSTFASLLRRLESNPMRLEDVDVEALSEEQHDNGR